MVMLIKPLTIPTSTGEKVERKVPTGEVIPVCVPEDDQENVPDISNKMLTNKNTRETLEFKLSQKKH